MGGGVRESGLEKGVSVIKEVSYRVVCHWSFIRMVFSVVFHQGGLLCGLSSRWSLGGLSSG